MLAPWENRGVGRDAADGGWKQLNRAPVAARPRVVRWGLLIAVLMASGCELVDGPSARVDIDSAAALAGAGDPLVDVIDAPPAAAPGPPPSLPAATPEPPSDPPSESPSEPPPRPAPGLPSDRPPPPVGTVDSLRFRALTTVTDPSARQIAARALGMVRFDWPSRLPGWELRFAGARPGLRGMAFPDRAVIEVYVRASDTPEGLAHVIAHELGHAVDVTYLTAGERAAWLAARGVSPTTPWLPTASGAADFATGAGDFAESFAWVHAPVGRWRGDLGPPPNGVQVALLASMAVDA